MDGVGAEGNGEESWRRRELSWGVQAMMRTWRYKVALDIMKRLEGQIWEALGLEGNSDQVAEQGALVRSRKQSLTEKSNGGCLLSRTSLQRSRMPFS